VAKLFFIVSYLTPLSISQIINVYEMVLIGEARSTRRETCPSAIFFTAVSTWTGVESNPGVRVERKAANLVNNGTIL